MKAIAKIFYFHFALLLLASCADEPAPDASESSAAEEQSAAETEEKPSVSEGEEQDMEKENEVSSEETVAAESDSAASGAGAQEALSEYSSEQIEYARVWLQLGANQAIDGLYVQHIPAGTPLNPDDETSGVYPEDVIQLAGSRLVDGSVTYSGNGDGTINVYNVPLRWDGNYPAGEEFYTDIINNTELVAMDVGEDEEVIRLINLLKMEP